VAYYLVEHIPVPAYELVDGIEALGELYRNETRSYLLGEVSEKGWWYFFPVALAVKTPFPFLILSGIGLAILVRRWWASRDWRSIAPAAGAVAILLVCLPSKFNIGLRYVLPVYPLLAVSVGLAAAAGLNLARNRPLGVGVVMALMIWQFVSVSRAHPDYLAYFNEIAGRSPDRILVDSDLDWGQDLLRLGDDLRSRHVDEVAIAYFGSADLRQHDLPRVRPLLPHQPTTGWIAISERKLKMGGFGESSDAYSWLNQYAPVATVGRSIRLYYITDAATADRVDQDKTSARFDPIARNPTPPAHRVVAVGS
jgi:hypothetical protein